MINKILIDKVYVTFITYYNYDFNFYHFCYYDYYTISKRYYENRQNFVVSINCNNVMYLIIFLLFLLL